MNKPESVNDFLKSKGLNEEEIKTVVDSISVGKKNKEAEQNSDSSSEWNSLIELLRDAIKEPEKIRTIFKAQEIKEKRKGIIQFVLIVALVLLALCGHLESTQTATIYGGIVGYILGHYE